MTLLVLRFFVIVAIVAGIGSVLMAFALHLLRSNPGISIQRGVPLDGNARPDESAEQLSRLVRNESPEQRYRFVP